MLRSMLPKALIILMICGFVIAGCDGGNQAKIVVGSETEIGSLTQITTEQTFESLPAWSLDGQSVLFVSDRFGGLSICRLNKSGGGGLQQLTAAPTELDADLFPDVNPRDESIVFASTRSRGVSQVFTVSAGNRGLTQLTNKAEGSSFPSWSPDGRQVAYCAPDRNKVWYVWIMSRDGSGLRQITPGLYPRWAPDGGRITFSKETPKVGRKAKNWDIYIVNVDGTGLTQITNEDTQEYEPDWSPDGNWLTYTVIKEAVTVTTVFKDQVTEFQKLRNYEIWVKNIAGGGSGRASVQLTRSSGRDINPRWSPDGKQIVFASDRSGAGTMDIWCMTPNIIGTPSTAQ